MPPPPSRRAARFARAHGLGEATQTALEALLRAVAEEALEGVVPASQMGGEQVRSPDAPAPTAEALPTLEDGRYVRLAALGQGGMGEVWRVEDRVLGRTVAMKILRPELAASEHAASRFAEEVRLTARLQHPGILPIYDVGRLADGRACYTMREAVGDTLARRMGTGSPGPRDPSELRRLVVALRRAIGAVAFAHEGGVIHGDIKPGNLMVGPFGDVVVLDWGLARTRSAQPRPAGGAYAGTPGYLAPELADGSGDAADPRGDVYALGATLWEILTRRRPPDQTVVRGLWGARDSGDLPGIPAAAQGLGRLALDAMAPDPVRRTATASLLGAALDDWLEGVIERDRALVLVQGARERLPRIEELRGAAERLAREAAALRDEVPTWGAIEAKRPGWALEDASATSVRDATLLEVAFVEELRAALSRSPDLEEARELLADHYQRHHAAAEARRDRVAAEAYEQLLRRHDRGRHAAWLAGTGWLSLQCDPSDATATLYRYEPEDRRLRPQPLGILGTAPIDRIGLPHGSYLVELSAPGHCLVRYPVRIDRGRHWDGVPPGADCPLPIALPPVGELGDEDQYVPAGWFRSGDPEARNGLPLREVWLDGFIARRFPVTNRAYVRWLNELIDTGDEDAALRHVPRGSDRTRDPAGVPIYPRAADGRFEVGLDPEGDLLDPDWPVVLVSWDSARAYAAGEAARTGRPWRLPWELEREKAVRGVDGRIYPWGDHAEPTWSHNGQAQRGRAFPARVYDIRSDESPYGVCGGAGNVRDRCLDRARTQGPEIRPDGRFHPPDPDAYDRDAPLLDRGGAWSAGVAYGRAGQRLWSPPNFRNSLIGFRLVRPWP